MLNLEMRGRGAGPSISLLLASSFSFLASATDCAVATPCCTALPTTHESEHKGFTLKLLSGLDGDLFGCLVIGNLEAQKSTRREERPETRMKTLFQHRQSCQICDGFPFKCSGDRCSVNTCSPCGFAQAYVQIPEGIGKSTSDFLRVVNLDRGFLFENSFRPCTSFHIVLKGTGGANSGRHSTILRAIFSKTLTSGACMRQCVAFKDALKRETNDLSRGNQP
jgi:hypothetical protein